MESNPGNRNVSIVPSVDVSAAHKQFIMFVEVLPRCFRNVDGEMKWVSEVGSALKDSFSYESIDDAITEAQDVGARLLGNVVPENLFFLLSEDLKAINDCLVTLMRSYGIFRVPPALLDGEDKQGGSCIEEDSTEYCAVVICKLGKAKMREELIRRVEQDGTDYGDCCQLSWTQMQQLQCGLEIDHYRRDIPFGYIG